MFVIIAISALRNIIMYYAVYFIPTFVNSKKIAIQLLKPHKTFPGLQYMKYVYCTYVFEQKVYVALDEPDGVAGVAAVRTSEPALYDEIVEFESTG